MTKCVDDASLLVPEQTDVEINEELNHVLKWAVDNKLTVNMAKTKELVFHRPNPTNIVPPTIMQEIERVLCAKLLGVWLQSDLGSRIHVEYVLHICNQRLYLLLQLKKQGPTLAKLQTVFVAVVLSRLF